MDYEPDAEENGDKGWVRYDEERCIDVMQLGKDGTYRRMWVAKKFIEQRTDEDMVQRDYDEIADAVDALASAAPSAKRKRIT